MITKLNYVPGEYEAFTGLDAGVITFGVSQYFVLKDDYKTVVSDVVVYADGVLMLPSEYTLSVDVKYTDIESTRTAKTLYSKIEVTNAAHDGKALTVDGNNFGSYTDNEANTLRVNTVVVTSALTDPLPYTNYLIDASGGTIDVTLTDATASTGEWYSFTLAKDSNHCNITTVGGQHIGDLLELSISTLNARVILQPSDATVYDGSAGYEITSTTRVNSRTIPVTGSLDLSDGFESGATYEAILADSTAAIITIPDWALPHVGDFAIFTIVEGANSSLTIVNESATYEQVITELEKQFVVRVGSTGLHTGQDSRTNPSESTLNFYPTTSASDIDPTYIKGVGNIGDPSYDDPAVDVDLGTVSSTTVEISLGKVADDSLQLGGTLPSRNVISLPNVRVTESGADRGVLLKFKYYKRNLTTDVEALILETEWSTPINSTTFGQYSIVGLLPQETWDGFVVIAEIVAIRRSGAGVAPNVELRLGGSSPSRSTLNVPATNQTHDSLAAKHKASDSPSVEWGHLTGAEYAALDSKGLGDVAQISNISTVQLITSSGGSQGILNPDHVAVDDGTEETRLLKSSIDKIDGIETLTITNSANALGVTVGDLHTDVAKVFGDGNDIVINPVQKYSQQAASSSILKPDSLLLDGTDLSTELIADDTNFGGLRMVYGAVTWQLGINGTGLVGNTDWLATTMTDALNASNGVVLPATLPSYGGLADTATNKPLGNVVSANDIPERAALGAKAFVAAEDVSPLEAQSKSISFGVGVGTTVSFDVGFTRASGQLGGIDLEVYARRDSGNCTTRKYACVYLDAATNTVDEVIYDNTGGITVVTSFPSAGILRCAVTYTDDQFRLIATAKAVGSNTAIDSIA